MCQEPKTRQRHLSILTTHYFCRFWIQHRFLSLTTLCPTVCLFVASRQCQPSENPAWHSWTSVATAGSPKCPRRRTNAPILSASALTLKPYLVGTAQSKTNQWDRAGIWSWELIGEKKDERTNTVRLSRGGMRKAVLNHQHLHRAVMGGPGKACQHLC